MAKNAVWDFYNLLHKWYKIRAVKTSIFSWKNFIEIYIFELHISIIYLKSAIWAWFYIHWVVFLFQWNNEIPGILFSTDSIKPANHIQQKTIKMKQSTSCAVYSFPKGFCNQASEFLFDFQIDMRENGCNFINNKKYEFSTIAVHFLGHMWCGLNLSLV